MGLFEEPDDGRSSEAPLADRMRPRDLDEFVGQSRIVGPGTALRRAIERDDLRSIILWGPAGAGKTSLARIIARRTRAEFIAFSAVMSGIREVREVMRRAEAIRARAGRRSILFIDEIHRFNKAQQDAFLPYVESGTIVLIGATTENPSFEINSALLSRSRVYRLDRLQDEEIVAVLERALRDDDRGLGRLGVDCPPALLQAVASLSQGDARAALSTLDLVVSNTSPDEDGIRRPSVERLRDVMPDRSLYYDKGGEEHFNLISALHKSMRNSDPDAALYWLARMLESGEEPLYVARRVVRFASEDVGLADPRALQVALAAKDAIHFVGRPEADLALAEAVVYNALAPKSNALYVAWNEVLDAIRGGADDPVPMALRNAPTGLMKAEGYGVGYMYAHDHDDALTDLECLPARLRGRRFYHPTDRGLERRLAERHRRSSERRPRSR